MALLRGPQPQGVPVTDFILSDFLPYQLSVLSARISREFSALYRERFGISVAEWRVVAHLSQTDEPVSVREIHLRVDMDKSKVSRAASRLESRGFVIKQVSASDRRLVALQLSPLGQAMIGELAPLARQFEREYLKRLGSGGREFRSALETMLAEYD